MVPLELPSACWLSVSLDPCIIIFFLDKKFNSALWDVQNVGYCFIS